MKQYIRQSMKSIRKGLPFEYQHDKSNKLCQRIKKTKVFRAARHIGLYHAANGEISLDDIWQRAPMQGKYCYFPVLNQDMSLSFLPVTPATPFKKNRFNILEPNVSIDLAIPFEQLDILYMPLVAFDQQGHRIGMGAGCYDRTLTDTPKPLRIGVAYEFQKQDFIASEPWDIQLHQIITPEKTYP